VGDDYVPTGFKPYGAKNYAVKGHPFGLNLPEEERPAFSGDTVRVHHARFQRRAVAGETLCDSLVLCEHYEPYIGAIIRNATLRGDRCQRRDARVTERR
jgi:hypothetical protein